MVNPSRMRGHCYRSSPTQNKSQPITNPESVRTPTLALGTPNGATVECIRYEQVGCDAGLTTMQAQLCTVRETEAPTQWECIVDAGDGGVGILWSVGGANVGVGVLQG